MIFLDQTCQLNLNIWFLLASTSANDSSQPNLKFIPALSQFGFLVSLTWTTNFSFNFVGQTLFSYLLFEPTLIHAEPVPVHCAILIWWHHPTSYSLIHLTWPNPTKPYFHTSSSTHMHSFGLTHTSILPFQPTFICHSSSLNQVEFIRPFLFNDIIPNYTQSLIRFNPHFHSTQPNLIFHPTNALILLNPHFLSTLQTKSYFYSNSPEPTPTYVEPILVYCTFLL